MVQDTRDTFSTVINQTMQQQYTARRRDQVARFFAGMELAAPGPVPVEDRCRPGRSAGRRSRGSGCQSA